MMRKSKPDSQPRQGTTLLKLHACLFVLSVIGTIFMFRGQINPADLTYDGWGLSGTQCLALVVFGGGLLFLIHLYSHRFYMARERKRDEIYFEALRLQNDDDKPTEADARRQALLNVKQRIAAQHNEKSL